MVVFECDPSAKTVVASNECDTSAKAVMMQVLRRLWQVMNAQCIWNTGYIRNSHYVVGVCVL